MADQAQKRRRAAAAAADRERLQPFLNEYAAKWRAASGANRAGLVSAVSINHAWRPAVRLDADGRADAQLKGGYELVSAPLPPYPDGCRAVHCALYVNGQPDEDTAAHGMILALRGPDDWTAAAVDRALHEQAFQELADMAAVIQSQTLLRL